jgi:two-component system sensor kinase FixL
VVRDETHTGEFRLVTKSGAVRWIGNRARLLPGETDGGKLRVLGAARDVTDRKRAEEAARRLQDDLAHVTRLSTLGEMASGIAHELNQPLAVIINHADACAMALSDLDHIPEPVRRDLEQIATQAERAADIIRRLRGLVAKRDSQLQSVDVNRCVEDVVSLLGAVSRDRGVAIEVELGTPPRVRADPVQVQQVVLNVVQNAIDAVAARGELERRVRITTQRVPAGAAVCVRDSGGPADVEVLERMFDPFFTTKSEGLGMGLTISRTIAENHGGRLEAEALAEGGVRIWFVLPEQVD